ncbi:DEKNAAC103800 [Brettanomyces naardenensis]|uniref:Glucose starvation modulator protein 1 n=1 Tax=Brettanomyces naardenensis TaxID=13370 RepID=A0A448YP82_BRENA|nr:DEKNAAC103800 [Brettanomyces naardenensis]
MTKRLPPEIKLSRRPTRVACEFCHSKHLQCDDTRPCKNCVKRGVQDSCRDAVRKKKSSSRGSIPVPEGQLLAVNVDEAIIGPDGKLKRKRRKYSRRKRKDSIEQEEEVVEQEEQEGHREDEEGGEDEDADEEQDEPTEKPELVSNNQNFMPFEDTSKAILPFSLSVTTLNKLLNPSQDIIKCPPQLHPPVIKEEDNIAQEQQSAAIHTLPMQIDPTFHSSTIRVINPDNTAEINHGRLSDVSSASNGISLTNGNHRLPISSPQEPESPNDQEPLEFTAPSSRRPSLASVSAASNTLIPPQAHSQGLLSAPPSIDTATGGHAEFYNQRHVSGINTNASIASDEAGVVSDNSSKPFMSTTANEEYVKLTDLLNTNPPSPSQSFWDDLAQTSTDDEDYASLPFIEIGIDDNTMRTSYPDNSTPNSYVYNEKHSQMHNTASEIPHDLQEDDDYTSPLIMRHVIKRPDDIYLTSIVKAYQYPKAYHALIAYLKKRFNKPQLIEIAKCMARYRPSFISATKSLYENDLIFTERSFQRTLLEYEQLINMSPSPTIIWRRTGEIVALTNEFATMTGYSKMSLLSKRTFIVELMDDESTLKYLESFSEMAFGDLNATYLTNCNLRKANDNDYLRCCCVWTIKRDVFDIPMLILGQFLPVLT